MQPNGSASQWPNIEERKRRMECCQQIKVNKIDNEVEPKMKEEDGKKMKNNDEFFWFWFGDAMSNEHEVSGKNG